MTSMQDVDFVKHQSRRRSNKDESVPLTNYRTRNTCCGLTLQALGSRPRAREEEG